MSIEMRHLRYFLAVADYGSVAEAARRMHIVQPALSRQIKDLEEELGAELFRRSSKGAELTVVGQHFVIDARRLLQDLDMAKERAIRIAQGQSGSLRIGVSPIYIWHPTVLSQIHEFKQMYPDIAIMLEPALSAQLLMDIADGKLDAGFMSWRDPSDPRYQARSLFECGLMLAIPRHGALSIDVPQQLAELKDQPCIMFHREVAPAYYDFMIRQFQLVGLTPRIVHMGGDINAVLGLVAVGMGYAIVPDTTVHSCPSAVLLVRHPELTLSYHVEFVWRRDPENTALDQFIRNLPQDL